MIASLPMYDRPETAAAHDALWAAIRDALRAEGVEAPEALDRRIGLREGWEHPGLVLGQTCGLPYRTRLHGRVALIGTFDHALPETPPGHYRSVFVARPACAGARPEDFAGAALAVNSTDSQSGWAAPLLWAEARGLRFGPGPETGAHRESARAVAEGRAEIAAIDAVTWRNLDRWEPELAARLAVLGATDPTPGLPLIAAWGTDPARHARAVAAGLAALAPEHRAVVGIAGFVAIPAEAYLAVPLPAAG